MVRSLIILCMAWPLQAKPDSLLVVMLENSLRGFDLMRSDAGMYADKGSFTGDPKRGNASIASVGMGIPPIASTPIPM